jgi:hypothetical protein
MKERARDVVIWLFEFGEGWGGVLIFEAAPHIMGLSSKPTFHFYCFGWRMTLSSHLHSHVMILIAFFILLFLILVN